MIGRFDVGGRRQNFRSGARQTFHGTDDSDGDAAGIVDVSF